jgi:hypothetical protein
VSEHRGFFHSGRLRAVAVLLLASAMTAPASAQNKDLASTIVPQAAAPIGIDSCHAYLRDTGAYIDEDVDFTSHAPKAVTAIRFLFRYFDPFGRDVGAQYGTITGTFKSDTPVKGSGWQSANTWPAVAAVRCSVDDVKFEDATTWQGTAQTAAQPTPPANDHPTSCTVTLIDKTKIDIPWDNPGCGKARASWAKTHPAPPPTSAK